MRKYLSSIVLTVLALISSVLAWKLGVFSQSSLPHYTIDVTIDHIAYTRYNAQGKAVLKIHAPKLTHDSQSHTVIISKPHIINQFDPQHRWDIWADKAKSDEHYKTIRLSGHVNMKEIGNQSSAAITLKTSQITLIPKQYAYTHAHVIVTQGLSSVQADGAKLDFKDNRLDLLGKTDVIEHPMQKER